MSLMQDPPPVIAIDEYDEDMPVLEDVSPALPVAYSDNDGSVEQNSTVNSAMAAESASPCTACHSIDGGSSNQDRSAHFGNAAQSDEANLPFLSAADGDGDQYAVLDIGPLESVDADGPPILPTESHSSAIGDAQAGAKGKAVQAEKKTGSPNAARPAQAPPVLQPEVITIDDEPAGDFEEPPLLLPEIAVTRKRKGIVRKRSFFGDTVDSSILKESVLEGSPAKRAHKAGTTSVQSKPPARTVFTSRVKAGGVTVLISRYGKSGGDGTSIKPKTPTKSGGATAVADRKRPFKTSSHIIVSVDNNPKSDPKTAVIVRKDKPLARRMGSCGQPSRRSGAARCRPSSAQGQGRFISAGAAECSTSTGWRSVPPVTLGDMSTQCGYADISEYNRQVYAPLPPPPGALVAPPRDPELVECIQKIASADDPDPEGVFMSKKLEEFLEEKAPLKLSFPVPDVLMRREKLLDEDVEYPQPAPPPPVIERPQGEPYFKTLLEKQVWLGIRDEKDLKAARSAQSSNKDATISEALPLGSLLLPPRYLSPARSSRELSVHRARHLLPLSKVMHKSLDTRRAWDEPAKGADCVQFIYDRHRQVRICGSGSLNGGSTGQEYGKLLRPEAVETKVNAWLQNDYRVTTEVVSRASALLVAATVQDPLPTPERQQQNHRTPSSKSRTVRPSPASRHSSRTPKPKRRLFLENGDTDGHLDSGSGGHLIEDGGNNESEPRGDTSYLSDPSTSERTIPATGEETDVTSGSQIPKDVKVEHSSPSEPMVELAQTVDVHLSVGSLSREQHGPADESATSDSQNRNGAVCSTGNIVSDEGVVCDDAEEKCDRLQTSVSQMEEKCAIPSGDEAADKEMRDIKVEDDDTIPGRVEEAESVPDEGEHDDIYESDNSGQVRLDMNVRHVVNAWKAEHGTISQNGVLIHADRVDEEAYSQGQQNGKLEDIEVGSFDNGSNGVANDQTETFRKLVSKLEDACADESSQDRVVTEPDLSCHPTRSDDEPGFKRSNSKEAEVQACLGPDTLEDFSAVADIEPAAEDVPMNVDHVNGESCALSPNRVGERAVSDADSKQCMKAEPREHLSFFKNLLAKHLHDSVKAEGKQRPRSDQLSVESNKPVVLDKSVEPVVKKEKIASVVDAKTLVASLLEAAESAEPVFPVKSKDESHNVSLEPSPSSDAPSESDIDPCTKSDVPSELDIEPRTKNDVPSESDIEPRTKSDAPSEWDVEPCTKSDVPSESDIEPRTKSDAPSESDVESVKLVDPDVQCVQTNEAGEDTSKDVKIPNESMLEDVTKEAQVSMHEGHELQVDRNAASQEPSTISVAECKSEPTLEPKVAESSTCLEATPRVCIHLPRFHLTAVRPFCLFHEVYDCAEYRPGGDCYMAGQRSRILQLERNLAIRTGRLPALPARHQHAARTFGRVRPNPAARPRHMADTCVALPPVPDGTPLPVSRLPPPRTAPRRFPLPEGVSVSDVKDVVLLKPVPPADGDGCYGVRLRGGALVAVGSGSVRSDVPWKLHLADNVIVTGADGRRFRNPLDRGCTEHVDVERSDARVVHFTLAEVNRRLALGQLLVSGELEGGLTLTPPARVRVMCRDRLRRVVVGQKGRRELFTTGGVVVMEENSGRLAVIGALPPKEAPEPEPESASKVDGTPQSAQDGAGESSDHSASGPPSATAEDDSDELQVIGTVQASEKRQTPALKRTADGDANPAGKKRPRESREQLALKAARAAAQLRRNDGKFAPGKKKGAKTPPAAPRVKAKKAKVTPVTPVESDKVVEIPSEHASMMCPVPYPESEDPPPTLTPSWVMSRLHSVTVEVVPQGQLVAEKLPKPAAKKAPTVSGAKPTSATGMPSKDLSATGLLMSVVQKISKTSTASTKSVPSIVKESAKYYQVLPQEASLNGTRIRLANSIQVNSDAGINGAAGQKSKPAMKSFTPPEPPRSKPVPKSVSDAKRSRSLLKRSFIAEPEEAATTTSAAAANGAGSRPGQNVRRQRPSAAGRTSGDLEPSACDPARPKVRRKSWADQPQSRQSWAAETASATEDVLDEIVPRRRSWDNPAARQSWASPEDDLQELPSARPPTGPQTTRVGEPPPPEPAPRVTSSCSRPPPTLLRRDGMPARKPSDGNSEPAPARRPSGSSSESAPARRPSGGSGEPDLAIVDLTTPEKAPPPPPPPAKEKVRKPVPPARRRLKLPLEVTLLDESDMSDDGLEELGELEAATAVRPTASPVASPVAARPPAAPAARSPAPAVTPAAARSPAAPAARPPAASAAARSPVAPAARPPAAPVSARAAAPVAAPVAAPPAAAPAAVASQDDYCPDIELIEL